jgi:hypothetical protein
MVKGQLKGWIFFAKAATLLRDRGTSENYRPDGPLKPVKKLGLL